LKKLLILFFIFPILISAQKADFDSTIFKGINHIYNINFPEAEKTFREVLADYPDHPAGRFFLAMIDWWKILLDLDNESYDDIFFAKLEDVIYQCDDLLEKNPNNVDALFFKGGAIGFRGRLRAFRESWIKAADDGREAMPLVNTAYKIDPGNVDIKLGFGIYDYYASVIPDKFPFIKPLMVFFPKGDKTRGLKELEFVAENGKYARVESKYFLMTLYYQFEENFTRAEIYAKQLTQEFPDNPLFKRYLGRINVKKGDYFTASSIFSDIFTRSNKKHTGYSDFIRREAAYYLGVNKKLNGEIDSALVYFKECADISKRIDKEEESGFLVNSILYLGMLNDQNANRDAAIKYYNELLGIRDYANSHNQAKRYLEKPYGKDIQQ